MFYVLLSQKSSPLKFYDPKQAEIRAIFGAKMFVRLMPTNDDKPKSTKIMPFRADLDYSCLLFDSISILV